MRASFFGDPNAPGLLRRLGYSPLGAFDCRSCFTLLPAGSELQRCSGCKEAHYCSAACQRADWGPRHKDEGKARRAQQAVATRPRS